MPTLNKNRGFTLVELVAVILLVGILSLSILPSFFSRDSFNERALRDELYSALHFVRQRAIDDHDSTAPCYSITWNATSLLLRRGITVISDYAGSSGQINLASRYPNTGVSPSSGSVFFDGLGNIYSSGCGVTPISTTDITITADQTVTLRIHGTGYVQRL